MFNMLIKHHVFDTLNHDLLIAKLHAYGFEYNTLKLFKSYLSKRWHRTKINTSFSSLSELITGVPQCSVLGPLLFNTFINYLFYFLMTQMFLIMQMTLLYMVVMKILNHS